MIKSGNWSDPRNGRFNGAALRRARSAEVCTLCGKLERGFNGAALRRARSGRDEGLGRHAQHRFNGAALRRARSAPCWIVWDKLNGASTGPRSGERGVGILANPTAAMLLLQRGRAPESAECDALHGEHRTRFGFNGAALRRARSGPQLVALPSLRRASTGPRSGERGVTLVKALVYFMDQLQRGRAPESAEWRAESDGGTGADWLQRGRAPESAEWALHAARASRRHCRFNGAALRRARSAESG